MIKIKLYLLQTDECTMQRERELERTNQSVEDDVSAFSSLYLLY